MGARGARESCDARRCVRWNRTHDLGVAIRVSPPVWPAGRGRRHAPAALMPTASLPQFPSARRPAEFDLVTGMCRRLRLPLPTAFSPSLPTAVSRCGRDRAFACRGNHWSAPCPPRSTGPALAARLEHSRVAAAPAVGAGELLLISTGR